MIYKILTKTALAAGLFLLADGVFLALSTNVNIGTALVLLAGAAFTSFGIWHQKIAAITAKGFLRLLKYVVLAGIIWLLCLIVFLTITGNRDYVKYDEDAVIVLGAAVHGDKVSLSLARRLDKAVKYANKNSDALIVVSGGRGPQEEVTEATAMKTYLVERGISEQRILKEEKATSTYENFKFSQQLLDKQFGDNYTCVYITNKYHSYRAGSIAKGAGLEAAGLGAKTDWYYLPAAYLRESLAVMKFWVWKQ